MGELEWIKGVATLRKTRTIHVGVRYHVGENSVTGIFNTRKRLERNKGIHVFDEMPVQNL